ncbi:MAG: helix-turn-helix transcriptional regulator [Devosia sp.]
MEDVKDADDVAIYDARKADLVGSAPMPAEVTMALLKGHRRIRAIRNWKTVTQQRLARDAGITRGHLSDLETGGRGVTAETAIAIARALGVPVGWIEG